MIHVDMERDDATLTGEASALSCEIQQAIELAVKSCDEEQAITLLLIVRRFAQETLWSLPLYRSATDAIEQAERDTWMEKVVGDSIGGA